MEEFQRIILVHYHEIGLKGRNRGVFEKRLQKNLEALLGAYPVVTIHRISGRLLVFLREGTTLEVANQCTDAILGVPGVARASCGFKCDLDIEVMGRAACIALAEAEPFSSFKVSAGRVYVVPFGDYQREISLSCPPSLRVILYRRLMFRVAEELARREGAGALVTGESLGQVASQTLDNIRATNDAVELPVLRPLIGSDKLEIIEAAQELGTFEISSMDAPDCCTLFMPRNPETHAKLEAVREAEAAFPVDEWVRALADAAEPHDYACPAYKPPKKRE